MPWIDDVGNRHEGDPPPGWARNPNGSYSQGGGGPSTPGGTPGAPNGGGPPPFDPGTGQTQGTTQPLTITANLQGPTPENQAMVNLNNHFQYGGAYGEANKDADYYRKIGEDAQGRPGAQIDNSRGRSYGNQAQGNAAAEDRVAALAWARATGKVPSIAGMRADQDMTRLTAEQTSAAAGARGPAALALAQQQAAQNTAQGTSTISNLAQINTAQERSDAEKAAFTDYSAMRGQDFQGQALEQDNAQKQAQIDAAQKAENDRMQLGEQSNEIDVNKAQLGAQGNQVGIAAGVQNNQNSNQTQKDIASDNRTAGYIGTGVGAGATVGGILLSSALMGGGNGAPVNENDNNPSNGYQGPNGGIPDDRGAGGGGSPADGGMGADGSSGNPADGPHDISGRAPVPIPGRGPAGMNRLGASNVAAPAPAPTLANIAPAPTPSMKPAGPPMAGAAPAPLTPPKPTLANTYKPSPAPVVSDERQKEGFVEEGGYSPAGGMSRDSRVLPGPIAPNRVDAFLDGIHPLSYSYKDPAQETRSSPTGGRYLGVSAQDMERTPTGKQLVSDGPRGKQLETGPSLSAALAGVARLHERVKDLETQKAGNEASLAAGPSVGQRGRAEAEAMRDTIRAGNEASLAAGPAVGGLKPMTARERALVAQAQGMTAGNDALLDAGPSVRRIADGTPETGYRTTLTDGAEDSFARNRQALYGNDSGNDYDLRGAYAAGESRAGNGHMTDRFKMPNHETFSDESQYAEARPEIAGHWEGERYTPKGPPAWLRQEMEGQAQFQPFRVTHADGRTMMITRPGEDFPEANERYVHPLLAGGTRKRNIEGPAEGYAADTEALGPSGEGNRDYPDYNFFRGHESPLDTATALETDRGAITPQTEDYMRRQGMWTGKTDALLRDRHLDRPDVITSDMRAKDDVVSEGEDRGVVAVNNGRFQPPAAPARAAQRVASRQSSAAQNQFNAESQANYDRAAHASTLAAPLGFGATLGSLYATKDEDGYQNDRRIMASQQRPPPVMSPASMLAASRGGAPTAAPTLASVYGDPTREEMAAYGARPEEIEAAMRRNGGR